MHLKAELLKMWILFFMSLATDVQTFSGKSFTVSSPLPSIVNRCFLRSFTICEGMTSFICISACHQNPLCLLACRNGTECLLYYANISPYWNRNSDDKSQSQNSECFSLWAERSDISSEIIFESTKPSNTKYTPSQINDGIGCQHEVDNVHAMEKGSSVWAKSDMKVSRKIKRVIIQTWNFPGAPTFFSDIEVRVGNYNGTGDFGANTLLGFYKGPATNGEIVTFEKSQPTAGRFLSIQSINGTGMVIVELKVITQ